MLLQPERKVPFRFHFNVEREVSGMITYFRKKRTLFEFIAFIAPAVIVILMMSEIPFLFSIYLSFMKWNAIAGNPVFNGLDNFKEIFTEDIKALKATLFTLHQAFWITLLSNVAALGIAILLNKQLKSKNLLRTLFFLPFVMSFLITSYMWKFIFTKGFESLYKLTAWDVFNLGWLSTPELAFTSVMLVTVWKTMGYNLLIYIAGLQSIPADLIEAAEMDGATAWQRVRHITLPLLMPAVTVSVFFSITNALNIFDIPYGLTNGGPGTVTTSISIDIYKEAFNNSRFGYASAKALLFFVLATCIAFIQVRTTKKREVEA